MGKPIHGCSLYNEYVINGAGMIQILNLRVFWTGKIVQKSPYGNRVFLTLKGDKRKTFGLYHCFHQTLLLYS